MHPEHSTMAALLQAESDINKSAKPSDEAWAIPRYAHGSKLAKAGIYVPPLDTNVVEEEAKDGKV
jgi:hypothetical protein